MPRHLSKEELSLAKECFAIYSHHHKLHRSDVGKALRSLGINPSNQDIQKMTEEMKIPSKLSWDDFVTVLQQDFPPSDSEEEIREAFAVFDKDGMGTISAVELKHILMTMGEKLTQEEVELIIKDAAIDDNGNIAVQQFVDIMKRT